MSVRFKPNHAGFRQLRTSAAVAQAVADAAEEVAARAGDGFEAQPVEITGGRGRARAAVVTVTFDAMLTQARDHTLERSL